MSFSIKRKRSLTIITIPALAITVAGILLVGNLLTTKNSDAISGWNADNIMSDYVMSNKSSMNTGDIQAFLNNKVPHCDTWGEQQSEFGGGTRRQWAEARGYSPPYTCLKDYNQHGKSAAQIIHQASQEFNINPQVLLVLLQKEQSLITDTWPLSIQYRSATGYGCPDTAACDSDYYGFTNQVRWASRMFRAIMNNSPSWYTPYELGDNFIRYSPDSSCGGSNVNIQNRATQALYNYTPYQPNQAALNAGWGTVHCGAYGNRNFYLYFVSWFGSTRGAPYTTMESPRWMQISQSVYKENPWTKEEVGIALSPGTHLRFIDKVNVNGIWYLRTEYDKKHGLPRGIRLSAVEDIAFELFENPRYFVLTKNARKVQPRSQKIITSQVFSKGTTIKFTSKININGSWFYRTEYDTQKNNLRAFYASSTDTPSFVNFKSPRYMQVTQDVKKINPITESQSTETITKGSHLRFTSKVLIDGTWYYRTEADTNSDTTLAISSNYITNIPYANLPDGPAWMRITSNTHKSDPPKNSQVGGQLAVGTRLLMAQSMTLNGETYYRTAYDSDHGLQRSIHADSLTPDDYSSVSPTSMTTTSDIKKIDTATKQAVGHTIPQGTSLLFTSRILIDGVWHYRTDYDTDRNYDRVISSDHLSAP